MGFTPFGYIKGPFYTYEIMAWLGPNFSKLETIYVGRGRQSRAMAYYRLQIRKGIDRYSAPRGHNPGLDAAIAAVRASGREISIIAHDHGMNLAACKKHEKQLISKYGRRHLGTGPLFNLNCGG